MLSMNTQLPVTPVTANAELGRVGITGPVEFALNSLLDGSRTVRSHPVAGDITIAHQATREFGGATRHMIRRNLKANGDLPAAAASLAIVAPNSPQGAIQARKAVFELIGALLTITNSEVVANEQLSVVFQEDGTRFTTESTLFGESSLSAALTTSLTRLINGEG